MLPLCAIAASLACLLGGVAMAEPAQHAQVHRAAELRAVGANVRLEDGAHRRSTQATHDGTQGQAVAASQDQPRGQGGEAGAALSARAACRACIAVCILPAR